MSKDELNGQMMMADVAHMVEEHREKQYQAFVDKFKEAKTTDDCYTPGPIYDAIAEWVSAEYGISRERFLRPFRPGGDYQAEEYPAGCAVVDNPPFSILSQIVDWYLAHGVKFFLFAPTLTIFSMFKKPERKERICAVLIGNQITYENGATVQTSYVTNMDGYAVRIEAALRDKLEAVNDVLIKAKKKHPPKYEYPPEVITGKDYYLAKWGQTLRIRQEDCVGISELDAQKEQGKSIFGGGLLLSERATQERARAQAAAEDQAAVVKWNLSPREWKIIQKLRGGGTQS